MRLRTALCSSRAVVRAGFTLMELLVVVAILLVLTSVAVPMYMGHLERSKLNTARTACKMLAGELQNYYISHEGNYPPENDWSLILMRDGQNPPLDPWFQPYQWALQLAGTVETQMAVPIVWSVGPDGIPGTADDISSQ